MKKTFTLLVFFFLSLGNAATSASACEFVAPQYQLQSDTVEWQMKAHFGETCRRGIRFKLISNPTIKVVASPEFGSLTVQGPSFSYTVGPDFHDQDSFTVEVSGFIGQATGTSTIHVTVSNIASTISSPRREP
ncbi:MAG: Ig-like domain-containing protein [Candidatus Acidiferrales bacterium]